MVLLLILAHLLVRVLPTVGYSLSTLITPVGSGQSVSIDGEFAAIGTPSVSSVTIYRLNNSTGFWDIFDSLSGGNNYGTHVRIFNQTLFVGGRDSPDSAYIYDLQLNETGHIWIERQTFALPQFLYESAMSCNYLVLGMDTLDDEGLVQIRVKKVGIDGTITWPELETFQAINVQQAAFFGYSVDIWDDKRVIVGEPDRLPNGVVYFYEINETRNETGIVDAQIVLVQATDRPNITSNGYSFGQRAAMFGDYVVVEGNLGAPSHGYVLYFYERDQLTGDWSLVSHYEYPDQASSGRLSMFNNYCIYGRRSIEVGSRTYIYHRSASTGEFELVQTLPSANESVLGRFGSAVDIDKDHAIIGASDSDGAVYIVSDFKPDDISSAPTSMPSEGSTQESARSTLFPSSEPTTLAIVSSTFVPTEDHQQQQQTEDLQQPDEKSESEESGFSTTQFVLVILVASGWACCMLASVLAIIFFRRSSKYKRKAYANELSKPQIGEHAQVHSSHSLPSDDNVEPKNKGKPSTHKIAGMAGIAGIAGVVDNVNDEPGSTLLEAMSHKMAVQLAVENDEDEDEVDEDDTDELYTQMSTSKGGNKVTSKGKSKGVTKSGKISEKNEIEIVETNDAAGQSEEGEA